MKVYIERHCGVWSSHIGPGRWCPRCGAIHFYSGNKWVKPDVTHDSRRKQPDGPVAQLHREMP